MIRPNLLSILATVVLAGVTASPITTLAPTSPESITLASPATLSPLLTPLSPLHASGPGGPVGPSSAYPLPLEVTYSRVAHPRAYPSDDDASDVLSTSSSLPTQVLPSSSVLVGSTTNVVPFTGIYPHLRYQPSIALNGPIVQDNTPFSPYFGNSGYDYSLGSLGGLGGLGGLGVFDGLTSLDDHSGFGLYKRQLGGGSPLGAGLGGAPLGPTIGGGFGSGFGGPLGGGGPIGGGGPVGAGFGGGPIVGPTNNFASAPSGTVTDTLIKPLVSITPHALEPVPVPVSTPYNYPVPVGVPTPVPTSVGTGFGRGKFGGFDDFSGFGGFGFGGFDRFGFGFDDGFDDCGFDDFDFFDF
ncbi:hypothetical protein CPC16_004724 [Podila verticillata]|nr:hypothetical protein CPC16_004724 [Podila verticillata]